MVRHSELTSVDFTSNQACPANSPLNYSRFMPRAQQRHAGLSVDVGWM